MSFVDILWKYDRVITASHCIIFSPQVMYWSSLDWLNSKNQESWHWDIVLGTALDVVVHITFMFCILKHITGLQAAVAACLAISVLDIVIFNGRYAWSTPGKDMRPRVKRRISTALPDYSTAQGWRARLPITPLCVGDQEIQYSWVSANIPSNL